MTTAIKAKFRSAKLFTNAWYRDHPTAWRPSSGTAIAAALTSWDAVTEWLTVTGDPVYYGYGDNVVVTDTEVYFSGQRAASLFDYAQAAAELAAAGAKEPAKTAQWKSLGTFALVPPQRFNARAYVTLSVNRVGFVRGTYVDALTKQAVPVKGAVDRAYQRVAWTTGEKGTTVFDTGLDNLTRAAAPLLVHYETKRTEQWLTVRVLADDGKDPPANAVEHFDPTRLASTWLFAPRKYARSRSERPRGDARSRSERPRAAKTDPKNPQRRYPPATPPDEK